MKNNIIVLNDTEAGNYLQKINLNVVHLNNIEEEVKSSYQKAEWAWSDVAVAFNEIGHDVSTNEKERIMERLFKKKLKSALWNAKKLDLVQGL